MNYYIVILCLTLIFSILVYICPDSIYRYFKYVIVATYILMMIICVNFDLLDMNSALLLGSYILGCAYIPTSFVMYIKNKESDCDIKKIVNENAIIIIAITIFIFIAEVGFKK